ncbi:MAG: gamma-glutamylcyclotransferase [Gammaproteobacteria bacterium]|nr:gamma-glutamylcyclotransferase [Gammaproteobacteria bacterium]
MSEQILVDETALRLFVYGTLKRGYGNHELYCRSAITITPAVTWGRIYHLPVGYPAMELPQDRILAYGTTDLLADLRTQKVVDWHETIWNRPQGDWDLIYGELITFANPVNDLPPIDRLEGFKANGDSLYQRVLIAAEDPKCNCLQTCWTYTMMHGIKGQRLTSGRWDTPNSICH